MLKHGRKGIVEGARVEAFRSTIVIFDCEEDGQLRFRQRRVPAQCDFVDPLNQKIPLELGHGDQDAHGHFASVTSAIHCQTPAGILAKTRFDYDNREAVVLIGVPPPESLRRPAI
jgi:hypothetical protein